MKALIILFISSVILIGCGSGDDSAITQTDNNTTTPLVVGKTTSSWQLLNSTHGINGNAWQLAQCDGCHLINDLHQQMPANSTSNIKDIVRQKGYQSCVGCHGSNGTELERPCLICHNTTDLPQQPLTTGTNGHGFNDSTINNSAINQSAELNDKQCLNCHIASDMNGQFDLATDLTRFKDHNQQLTNYQDNSDFCLRCHNINHQQRGFEIENKDYQNPLVAMKTNYQFIDVHGDIDGSGERTYAGLRAGYQYQQRVQCTDCHSMHGTHNEQLIIGSSAVGASKLIKTGVMANVTNKGPFDVTIKDHDTSPLCVLCHQMKIIVEDGNEPTSNGLSGVHLTGQACNSCHTHGMATQVGL